MNSIAFHRLASSVRLAGILGSSTLLVAPAVFAGPPPITVTQPVQVQVVNAQPIAVSGSVAVTGPLNVNLVPNSSDTPVYVQTAKQPLFRERADLGWNGAYRGASAKITNTTGARILIQQISTIGQVVAGVSYQFVRVDITGESSGMYGVAILKPTSDGTDPFGPQYNQYSANMAVNLFLDPGESLNLTGYLTQPGGNASVTVSGIVVD